MPPTRPRRIVRRAVLVLVVAVSLPVGYIGSVMMFCFADRAGLLPAGVYNIAFVVYDPLERYLAARYPGTDAIMKLIELSREAGDQARRHKGHARRHRHLAAPAGCRHQGVP